MYKKYIKRLIDCTASGLGILAIAPLLALIAVLVRRKLGSPILFRQTRPGLQGRPFELVKFRTMTDERDSSGKLLPNSNRMTPFGMFLRSSSLDELPELWNVLKGEMSLVGPRPLLMDYLPYYDDFKRRRHEAKPGITGWAQINGRNALSWDQKFALDVWYIDNQSFSLDLKILLMTLVKVARRDGISHEGNVSMPRFDEYVKRNKS
jgi:lipopolysaccharide/colanic/teichoic acid biosynthesis glycosyltransferase